MNLRRLRLLLAAGLVALVATFVSATGSSAATTYLAISGSGSTWSQNALDQWRRNVASNYGMTVNYSGTGSSAGRTDFINGTVDFAVSEIPFQARPEDGSAPERPARGYAYMPIVAGGTAFMYNLKISGRQVTNLRLSGEVITKIFTNVITRWNDPAIQADNPGLAMPDKAITPVVRSDGSGTTAQFTLWMSKQYSSLWNSFCAKVGRANPCGLTSQYPVAGSAKAQNGSLGVAGYVSQSYGEGAITYVEYSYALKSGFPVAKVLNAGGYYVEPTSSAVAVALLQARINTDANSTDYLTQILDGVYGASDKRAYPLSSYSYMIIPTEAGGVFTTAKGATLGDFTRYLLCEGQQQAAALGYSPLPMNLVMAGSEQIARIPGAGNAGVDFNSCNNPTFKAGDSPSNNRLAATAPQPPECDKKGTTQCATGTGGAAATSTSTSGGTGAGNPTPGGPGAPTDDSADGELDTLGLGSDDGTTGGTGTAAQSHPFTVRDEGMGPSQWLMVGAGALFLGVIVVPPLLSRRLRNSRPGS